MDVPFKRRALHGVGFMRYPYNMKTTRSNISKQSKQGKTKKPKPDIRDDKDSRKNREAGYRGTISKTGDRKKGGLAKKTALPTKETDQQAVPSEQKYDPFIPEY